MWRVSLSVIAMLLVATPTHAAVIYQFSGTLTTVTTPVSDAFGITSGDSFSGYLMYHVPDPAPPLPPGFNVPDEGGVSWQFLWAVNGFTFSSTSRPGFRTYAESNEIAFDDFLPLGPQATPTVVFWDDARYILNFASPLTSWNIDASQFLTGALGYSGFGPGFIPTYAFSGPITSFQEVEVSEPSSTLLLLSGAAVLLGRRITRGLARSPAGRHSTHIPQ